VRTVATALEKVGAETDEVMATGVGSAD